MAPRLSYKRCQQRKVKYDELDPCRSCQREGALYLPVESFRLPRGRTKPTPSCPSGRRNLELTQKITRLERLVEVMTTKQRSDFLSIGEIWEDSSPKDSSGGYSQGNTFQSDRGIGEIGSLADAGRSYAESSSQKVGIFAICYSLKW